MNTLYSYNAGRIGFILLHINGIGKISNIFSVDVPFADTATFMNEGSTIQYNGSTIST